MRSDFCTLLLTVILLSITASFSYAGNEFQFDTFVAMIGLDDGCIGREGSGIFRVLLDGKVVFKSDVLKPGDTPKYIAVPLKNASKLTLIVDDVGDGHGGDWGNWADARLVDIETGEVIFLSDMEVVVEKKWIDTKMDRNIIEEPLKIKGKIYAKGLGAISSSRMTYSGWNKQYVEQKSRLIEEDKKALKKFFKPSLIGKLHAGVKLTINGHAINTVSGSIDRLFSAGERVEIEFVTKLGENILRNPALNALKIRYGSEKTVPLAELLPSRIEHMVPGDTALPVEDEVILNSRRYFASTGTGYGVKVIYENLPSQIISRPQLLSGPQNKKRRGLHLVGIIGIESPDKHPYATTVFSVRLDDKTAYRSGIITAATGPVTIEIPIGNASDLTIEVDDAGDGRYQDSVAWADIAIIDITEQQKKPAISKAAEQYLLSSFKPYISKSGHGRTNIDSSAKGELILLGDRIHESGFGVYAPSRIAFKDLKKAIERRSAAIEQIRKSKELLIEGEDILALEKYILKAKNIDDTISDIYPILGKIAERKGNIQAAIDAWERLIDISHASRREKRLAKNIIDKLYIKGGFTHSQRFPKNQPPVFNHPLPAGKFQNVIFTVTVGKPYETKSGSEVLLPGSFVLDVDKIEAGKYCTLLVNSCGLGPVLRIAKTDAVKDKPAADYRDFSAPLSKTSDYVYEWKLEEGSWTIFVDYSRSNGYDNTCSFYIVYTVSDGPVEKPSEEWEYTIKTTGVVDVKCTVTGNSLLLIPHTAEGIEIENAKSYICWPLYEYGSTLSFPYSMGKILMLSTANDGAIVTFRWLDGAYNVPMTRHGDERRDTFFFESIPGINPVIENIKVVVTIPEDTSEVKLLVPENPEIDGLTYTWSVPSKKSIRLNAKLDSLDTKWLDKKHRSMTVYLPDNQYNRRWLPEYMELLKRIYDRESFVMGGYEPDTETFVYLTGAAQLSGYGGATWGGENSETWIASTGRIGEYHLRCRPGGDGVEAHELKWVFLGGNVKSLPRWLQMGTVIWLEEQGKYIGNLAFSDYWTHVELIPKSRRHIDMFTKRGMGYARLEDDEFGTLTNDEKKIGDAMCWYICQWLHDKYGDEFWHSFWKMQRNDPDAYTELDPRSRTIKAVNDIIAVTGDRNVRKQFEKWGFDLRPDPQYSEKYYRRLPKQWAFKTGDDPAWSKPDFDDSGWEKIDVGKTWEKVETYAEYDGFAWYRLRLKWPAGLTEKNLVLDLGKIDDSDEVFFNSVKIGCTGTMPPDYSTSWTIPRKYNIPEHLVKKHEENIIAVRIYDGGGGGGIYDRTPGILSLIKKRR